MGKPTTTDYGAIRQLVERFSDAVNRVDGEAWIATWAPDGEWQFSETFTGREQILAGWWRAMSGIVQAVQVPYSGVIDNVEGNHASGRWYLGAQLHLPDGAHLVQLLRYDDLYVRIDGEWLFERRTLARLYRGPADLSGQFFEAARGA